MKKYIFIFFIITISYLNVSAQANVGDEQNIKELIEKGIKHHDAREYKQAIEKYEQALRIDKNSMVATYEMALSYLELKDYKNASAFSKKVIESNNKDLVVGAYGVNSESLAKTGRVDQAIKILEEAIRKHGNDYYLHFNLALNYFSKGNLDKTIFHVDNALNLSKSQSGAYLLSAYSLADKDIWVQSILSFHVFLLMEPDSHRSKNAFEEMLQVMQVKESSEKPVERSFIQKQLERKINPNDTSVSTNKTPALDIIHGLNRELIYRAIENTKDSLKALPQDSLEVDSLTTPLYKTFKEVTRTIFTVLSKENDGSKNGSLWNFYIPITTKILESNHFDTYCRYISVAYFPESIKWWENNQELAAKFVRWFEKGDENE